MLDKDIEQVINLLLIKIGIVVSDKTSVEQKTALIESIFCLKGITNTVVVNEYKDLLSCVSYRAYLNKILHCKYSYIDIRYNVIEDTAITFIQKLLDT